MSNQKDLATFLCLPSTSDRPELAVDALVEFIQARRNKNGQSFYEVMLVLIELMQKVPPSLDPQFDLARNICHIPPLADLSPPVKSPFITKSTSSALLSRIVSLLSRCPEDVSLENAREGVLEWCLGVEGRIMDGKGTGAGLGSGSGSGSGVTGGMGDVGGQGWEGRGGPGTIGMAGFDEIEIKFREIVAALPRPDPNVLALLLSLRLTLSYLSYPTLLSQLSELSLPDSESVLRQWVKRRLPGEGRFTLSEKLNLVEREVGQTRPALKAVIKLVRAKYVLPEKAIYRVQLPSQGKSKVLVALQSFTANGTAPSPTTTSDKNGPTSPIRSINPGLVGPPNRRPPAYRAPSASDSGSGHSRAIPTATSSSSMPDTELRAYAIEVLSEWLTKEKRDYMRGEKWTKSGRKTLSKELNEIEDKLSSPGVQLGSIGKARKGKEPAPYSATHEGGQTPVLAPIFAMMRRTYNLDRRTPIGTASTDGPTLPSIDLPDESEPYHPPTAQSVTSALYCNPRLSTDAAIATLLDLVECEKDTRIQSAVATITHSRTSSRGRWSHEGSSEAEHEEAEMREVAWGFLEKTRMARTLQNIARRFPDGEYAEAFKQVGERTDCPPQLSRAPSYKSVASVFTAERTASYLRGATSHRGSASISHFGPGPMQFTPFQALTPLQMSAPHPIPPTALSTRPEPIARSSAPLAVAPWPHIGVEDNTHPPEVVPNRPVAHHTRASSLPTTPSIVPRFTILPSLSIPSLSSLISDTAGGSEMLSPTLDQLDEGFSPATTTGDVDFEAIYAGYGDAIQPMCPDGMAVEATAEHSDGYVLAPVPARRISWTSPQPRSAGGAIRSSPSTPNPIATSSFLDRSRPVVLPRRADTPLAAPTVGGSGPAILPTGRLGHSRQTPSLSPSSWRQEFMGSNVLKPAPRSGVTGVAR